MAVFSRLSNLNLKNIKTRQKSGNEERLCDLFVPFLLKGPVTCFGFHQTAAATVYEGWLSSYVLSAATVYEGWLSSYVLSAAIVYEGWLSSYVLSAATVYEGWLS